MDRRTISLALVAGIVAALTGCATGPEPLSPEALERAVPSLAPSAELVAPEFAVPVPAPAAMPAIPEREARSPARPQSRSAPPAPALEARVPSPMPAPPTEVAGFVIRDRVNLRPCPEENDACGPIAELRVNEEVRVVGEESAWLRIAVPRVQRVGYVARRFVGPRRVAVTTPVSQRSDAAAAQAGPPAKLREEPTRPESPARLDAPKRQDTPIRPPGGAAAAPTPPPQEELIQ
jgi:hypothetical protein